MVVWLGMAMAIPRVWSVIRRPKLASVTDHLCFVAMSVWICQTVLDGFGRVYFAPHYYAATWTAYLFFAWLAADWVRSRIRKIFLIAMIAVYAASLLLGMGIIAATIAETAGTRSFYYGTSLGNQVAAVRKLCDYSGNSNVSIQLPQWKSFPLAWKVILELNPPPPWPRPRRNLLVRYRDAEPPDAHIEVEEVPGS